MYDVSDVVTTNPALAVKERLALTRQSTISGVSADVFYIEFLRDGSNFPQIYIGSPGGTVGFRTSGGDNYITDRVLRCEGIHIIDTGGHHTAMLQYGSPGCFRLSPDTAMLWAKQVVTAQGELNVGFRASLTDEVEVVSDTWSSLNTGSGTAQSRLRLRAGGRVRADSWSMMVMVGVFSRTTNVATYTTNYTNTVAVGDVVRITGATDTSFNGTFTVTLTQSGLFQCSNTGSDVGSTGGQDIRVERMTQKTATRAVASNVATLTVATRHGLCNGQWVVISGMTDTAYNGTFRITTTSATAFTYALTHANESATADTAGTITSQGILELGSTSGLILLNDVDTVTGTTVQVTLAGSVLSPTALAADANNYAPGRARTYRLTTSGGGRSITGLVAGWDGEERYLFNANALAGDTITLAHESGSSTAANRFVTSTGLGVVLAAQASATRIWYDDITGRWRV